jgi:hypothetical protein
MLENGITALVREADRRCGADPDQIQPAEPLAA